MLFRRKPSKYEIRRELARVLIDLKQLHKRAFHYRSRIEGKIKEYEEKLLYATDEGMRQEYIKNISMYQNALRVISKVEATLELLIIRLETLGLLGVTAKEIILIKDVLKKIKDFTDWIPDISLITEDIMERAGDLLDYFPTPPDFSPESSREADKILEEAEVIAKEKMSMPSTTI